MTSAGGGILAKDPPEPGICWARRLAPPRRRAALFLQAGFLDSCRRSPVGTVSAWPAKSLRIGTSWRPDTTTSHVTVLCPDWDEVLIVKNLLGPLDPFAQREVDALDVVDGLVPGEALADPCSQPPASGLGCLGQGLLEHLEALSHPHVPLPAEPQ